MEELLGTLDGRPSELTEALYEVWSEGGWGMVISGASQSSCKVFELWLTREITRRQRPSLAAPSRYPRRHLRPLLFLFLRPLSLPHCRFHLLGTRSSLSSFIYTFTTICPASTTNNQHPPAKPPRSAVPPSLLRSSFFRAVHRTLRRSIISGQGCRWSSSGTGPMGYAESDGGERH